MKSGSSWWFNLWMQCLRSVRRARLFPGSYLILMVAFAALVVLILLLLYGSLHLRGMLLLPALNGLLVAVVILFVYALLHNVRVTERSNLWVGLAKETAHQLGTPISSLMGWVEYIRAVNDAESTLTPQQFMAQVGKICDDMEHDLARLRKVTNRFSQIGSVPAKVPGDLNAVIDDAMQYFRLRLPLLGKRIELVPKYDTLPEVAFNKDLLEWVFENLFKNAIDAMDKDDGFIEVRTEYSPAERIVRVHHYDNGRGVPWDDQVKLFTPGFTTKKRGWGLGLTLAKRIVEEYHGGRIFLHWSQKNMGSVFCIELPVNGHHERGRSAIPSRSQRPDSPMHCENGEQHVNIP